MLHTRPHRWTALMALASALVLPTGPAHASASGSADILNLRFTLVDLDTGDATTPSLSLGGSRRC